MVETVVPMVVIVFDGLRPDRRHKKGTPRPASAMEAPHMQRVPGRGMEIVTDDICAAIVVWVGVYIDATIAVERFGSRFCACDDFFSSGADAFESH